MFYCNNCYTEFDNDLVDDTNFDFVSTKSGYKIKYHQKCSICGGELTAGFIKDNRVNIGRSGDPKQFYSIDLGTTVESPKHLDKILKKRGMVNLMESKEYRENEARMENLVKERYNKRKKSKNGNS